MVLRGRTLLGGDARGPVAAIAPLSFWGGYDPVTGRVVDRSHPDVGRALGGTVLAMGAGRGSSSSASVLAEALRLGTGPAALVLSEPDAILLAGALVAAELYGRACPVAVLSPDDHRRLGGAGFATVAASLEGTLVRIEAAPSENGEARG